MEDVIKSIVAGSRAAIGINEGDYEKDGLLYCGRCNTPKQKIVTMSFGECRPYQLCKCEAEKRHREEAEAEAKHRDESIRRRRLSTFSSEALAATRLAQDDGKDQRASVAAKRFVEQWEAFRAAGKGVIFFGGTGTGKTFFAAAIANAIIDKDESVAFLPAASIFATIFAMDDKQAWIDRITDVGLLVIDDLGTERTTEASTEAVYKVVNERYSKRMPLIVTTNYTAGDMREPKTEAQKRLFSRLVEMCVPVTCIGEDRRKEKAKAEIAKWKEMLK